MRTIAFCITLSLYPSRLFTVGFGLVHSSPTIRDAATIASPRSPSIVLVPGGLFHSKQKQRQRAPPHVLKMKATPPDEQIINRYESPFFPINEYNDQNLPSSSALIILNTPINNTPSGNTDASLPYKQNGTALSGVLGSLWRKSSYRVCADGGANRLYEATVIANHRQKEKDEVGVMDDSTTRSADYLPDLITGDLDSLYPHVYEYYKSKGVGIVRVEDQDFHDLDKSLMAIEKWIENEAVRDIHNSNAGTRRHSRVFIYGGFGGRFDQEMAVINALCVWGKKETFRQTTLAVYDEQTCAFLLSASPTTNHIRIRYPGNGLDEPNQSIRVGEGPTCGLIPILGRCEKVFTTGLQWNLNGELPIEFGGLVSSSNRVIDDVVVVETSSPMLFTAEMIVSGVGCANGGMN